MIFKTFEAAFINCRTNCCCLCPRSINMLGVVHACVDYWQWVAVVFVYYLLIVFGNHLTCMYVLPLSRTFCFGQGSSSISLRMRVNYEVGAIWRSVAKRGGSAK